MHAFRRSRRFSRALIAMLFVALAAHGFAPAAAGAIKPENLTLEQALRVICSAAGTRGLDQGHHGMRPGDICPLCPAFSGPAVSAPAIVLPAAPAWTRMVRTAQRTSNPVHPVPARRFLARAPPSPAFA